MATTQTIDATIFASSHPDIAKRTSVSGVLISSVMLLIGILAFASTFELDDKSSTTSMALMVLGTGLFLMGEDKDRAGASTEENSPKCILPLPE